MGYPLFPRLCWVCLRDNPSLSFMMPKRNSPTDNATLLAGLAPLLGPRYTVNAPTVQGRGKAGIV
jgi:hypothetical protein